MSIFVGFLLSLCGSLGYGMMVNAPRQTLLSSALTGGLAWIAYLLILDLTGGIWLANLVASLMIGVLSNVFAKRIGTPVNILSIPSGPWGYHCYVYALFCPGGCFAGSVLFCQDPTHLFFLGPWFCFSRRIGLLREKNWKKMS